MKYETSSITQDAIDIYSHEIVHTHCAIKNVLLNVWFEITTQSSMQEI